MIRWITILLTGIVMSMFYFPFELTALPGVNTKMGLAVVGLLLSSLELAKQKSVSIPKELLILLLIASFVSVVSLLSITVNQTPDTTYVSYIFSFSVWLSAAFAVCCMIKWTHGRVGIQLILDYLIAVCLIQCVLAIVIDSNPAFARFVNRYTFFGQDVCIAVKRLYGIGFLLDVAGLRMAAVLAGIAYYLSELNDSLHPGRRLIYILSFIAITVMGNMIARTTIVGLLIGLAFILYTFFRQSSLTGIFIKPAPFFTWMGTILVGIVVCTVLYRTDPHARSLFRFAFEGFFSLAEKGRWEVSSNETLKGMVVFPETLHTWIIGDGYFMNSRYDANYLGDSTDQGFYMGTDVGYLRFIFYFGVTGLVGMMAVIIYSSIICIRHFRKDSLFFLLALLVGLVVWAKVSTDVFCFLALFLSAAALQNKEKETDFTSPSGIVDRVHTGLETAAERNAHRL